MIMFELVHTAVEAHDARGLRRRVAGDGLAALRERGHDFRARL